MVVGEQQQVNPIIGWCARNGLPEEICRGLVSGILEGLWKFYKSITVLI